MDEKRKALGPKARAEKYENLNCLMNVLRLKFGNRYELPIDDGYLNGKCPYEVPFSMMESLQRCPYTGEDGVAGPKSRGS